MTADDFDFDAAGHVIRARRLGDLSQRDLAQKVGVSQSGIVDIEAGRRQVSVALFARILETGGLRLCVVDAEGVEVRPVSPRVVRDNAGRRFPAHLDLGHPDQLPPERIRSPRYDREPAKAWYHLRQTRDRLRAGSGQEQPMDHLTAEAIRHQRRVRLETRRAERRAEVAARRAATGEVEVECACDTECWGGAACVAQCRCQCEPA